MKTLTPNFNLLESEKTPDYSPHVPPARLPLHIRERGRKLVAVHAMKKHLGEIATSFHTFESVYKKLAPTRNIETIERSDELLWNALDSAAIGIGEPLAKAQLMATLDEAKQGKPRAVAMDELDWEFSGVSDFIPDFVNPDSLLLPEPLAEYDVMLHLEMDSMEPTVPIVQTKALITSVSWGEPDVTEINDIDTMLFDE